MVTRLYDRLGSHNSVPSQHETRDGAVPTKNSPTSTLRSRCPRQRGQFANLRAEGYWGLYELFNQEAMAIPDDAELAGQLSSLRHRYNSRGPVPDRTQRGNACPRPAIAG